MNSIKLIKGNVYFHCVYHAHPKYWIPIIKTYVYVEKTTHDSKDAYLFQNPNKYFQLDSKLTTDLVVPEDCLDTMYDVQGLKEFIAKLKTQSNADKIFD